MPGTATFKIYAPTLKASRDAATGAMRIEGIASSTVRDHHGDTITAKALRKMERSAVGMTIFMNHEYRVPQDVFGTVEKAHITKGGKNDKGEDILDLRLGIIVAARNKPAVDTFELIETDKIKLGLSIGAMVPEGGATYDTKSAGGRLIVDDINLIETSVVAIPANPRSFIDYAFKAFTGKFPDRLGAEERKTLLEQAAEDGAQSLVKNDAFTDTEAPDEVTAPEPVPAPTEPDPEGEPASDDTSDASLEKARVTVWDGDKSVIEVDTGRAKPRADETQSAQATPETAGGASSSDAGEVATKDLGDTAITATLESTEDVDAQVITAANQSLQNQQVLVRSLHAQLIASRAANEDLMRERDAAIEVAKASMEGTRTLIAQLGELPMGRKTGYAEVQKGFNDLEGIYDESIRKVLNGPTKKG